MNRPLTRLIFIALFLCGLTLGAGGFLSGRASAHSNPVPASAVQAFLYPPYPGSASQESIFDHTSPNYMITYFNGSTGFHGVDNSSGRWRYSSFL